MFLLRVADVDMPARKEIIDPIIIIKAGRGKGAQAGMAYRQCYMLHDIMMLFAGRQHAQKEPS